jgi:hypothetical protein
MFYPRRTPGSSGFVRLRRDEANQCYLQNSAFVEDGIPRAISHSSGARRVSAGDVSYVPALLQSRLQFNPGALSQLFRRHVVALVE